MIVKQLGSRAVNIKKWQYAGERVGKAMASFFSIEVRWWPMLVCKLFVFSYLCTLCGL